MVYKRIYLTSICYKAVDAKWKWTNRERKPTAAKFGRQRRLQLLLPLHPLTGIQTTILQLVEGSRYTLASTWITREIPALGSPSTTLEVLFVWGYVIDPTVSTRQFTDTRHRPLAAQVNLSIRHILPRLLTRLLVWHGVKGFRNSPYGERRIGGR